MIMCLDIETTFKKDDLYSYNGNNQLVSVGYKTQTGKENYIWRFTNANILRFDFVLK